MKLWVVSLCRRSSSFDSLDYVQLPKEGNKIHYKFKFCWKGEKEKENISSSFTTYFLISIYQIEKQTNKQKKIKWTTGKTETGPFKLHSTIYTSIFLTVIPSYSFESYLTPKKCQYRLNPTESILHSRSVWTGKPSFDITEKLLTIMEQNPPLNHHFWWHWS